MKLVFYGPGQTAPVFAGDRSGVWLVGYDGGVKAYAPDAADLERFLDLIDGMPMRQAEIAFDSC